MDMITAIAWQPILLISILMIFDIITGFGGAAKEGVIQSGKMREGLWHKAGFLGLVILAIIWEVVTLWVNFDADQMGISAIIPELPAVSVVCAFIALIELVSIIENLCVLNPHIATLPFIKQLKAHDPAAPDLTVEVDHETSAETDE